MTDNEILDHLQHDKYSLALKGLYNVLPSVKKYVRANNGTSDDADDIFQDALMVLYKKAHTPGFTLTADLKTYLLAIVKNCWNNEQRKSQKLPIEESNNDPADVHVDEEPAMIVATNAFRLLGEKCKELLIAFYYKKMSYGEIAMHFSFRDDKVAKNQKYRCLQKAKEHYLTLSKKS